MTDERCRVLSLDDDRVEVHGNIAGSEGRLIEVNPEMVRMFGYERREDLFAIAAIGLYQRSAPKVRGCMI